MYLLITVGWGFSLSSRFGQGSPGMHLCGSALGTPVLGWGGTLILWVTPVLGWGGTLIPCVTSQHPCAWLGWDTDPLLLS